MIASRFRGSIPAVFVLMLFVLTVYKAKMIFNSNSFCSKAVCSNCFNIYVW
jgi:hypothetical protein